MRFPTKKILLFVLIGFIAAAAGVGARFYFALHADSKDIYNSIGKSIGQNSAEYEEFKKQGSFNMLIMGEDNVEGSRRSDTILFTHVDVDDKNVRVLSLPRDTKVEIPGHGEQKLNHAFAFGGPELMEKTVENLLGKSILYYVVVDYDSFPELVDALGGIDIDVKKRMRYTDHAGHLDINIQAGPQHMNGITALHFVRFRHDALGDIGRVQRQQQFIKALIKKAYDPRVLVNIPQITSKLFKVFKTDMSPTLAVQLAGFVQNELGRERIFFSTLHGTPAMIRNLSYWIGDVRSANAFLDVSIDKLMSHDVISNDANDGRFGNLSLSYSSAMDESADGKKQTNGASDDKNAKLPSIDSGNGKDITKTELTSIIRSMSESIAVLNGDGAAGVSDQVASRLQKMGVDVEQTGNAKHFDYQSSNVVYPLNAGAGVVDTAKKLGRLLGIPKNLVRQSRQAFYPSIIIGHDKAVIIKRLDGLLELSIR